MATRLAQPLRTSLNASRPYALLPGKVALRAVSELRARRDLRHKLTDRGHPKHYTVVASA
jgi:hypothetical protein